jgi:hypothetical protein
MMTTVMMTMTDDKELEISLDELARGDATPAEAAHAIRVALAADPPLTDRVYDALRDVTWRVLTSRSFGDELRDWFNVFRHASALAADSGIAEKIRGFADLISQSARFAELQPLDEVLSRKHSKSLLGALAVAGGALQKGAIKKFLRLADSNLSRVTGALLGRGLIERSTSGKEASFELTALGLKVARELGLTASADNATNRVWCAHAPFALAVWDSSGKPIGANAAFQALTAAGPGSLPTFSDWRGDVSKAAREERRPSSNTWQVRVGEGKWYQYVAEVSVDGDCCVLASDISAQMKALRSLEDRLEAGAEKEVRLQRERADAEGRILAFRSAISQIKEEVLDAAAQSNSYVRKSIDILEQPSAATPVPGELHQVERHLDAIQRVMRDVMGPIDVARLEDSRLDCFDPKQIVAEAAKAASASGDPYITYEIPSTHMMQAELAPLRMALGQMFIIGMKHGFREAHAAITGSQLVTTFHAKGLVVGRYSNDPVTSLGLSYCKHIAETHGGALEIIEQSSGAGAEASIKLSFPVTQADRLQSLAASFVGR